MSLTNVQPDIAMAEEFFDFWGAEDRDIDFRTFDDSGNASVKPLKIRGDIYSLRKTLTRENQSGAGIFFVVNKTDAKGQLDSNIVGVRALFLDLDGAPLEPVLGAKMLPHILVESSPLKFHTYYLMDKNFPLHLFTVYQKALAKKFGGDSSVSNLSRVLRTPGFWHMKDRNNPFLSRVLTFREDMPYSAEDFAKAMELDISNTDPTPDSGSNRHLSVVKQKQEVVEFIPSGMRDVTLHRMGATFRNTGAKYDEMLDFLIRRNTWCEVPLPQRQVEKIARQVCKLDSYIENDLRTTEATATPKAGSRDHSTQPQEATPKKGISRFIKSAKTIEKTETEPLRWVIPDVLPQGLVILAGAPKMGKSLLIQQISYAVALGGPAMGKFPTIQGACLHLALEDSEARFRQRMEAQKQLLHNADAPDDLMVATEWSFWPDATEDIRSWCQETPNAKLVVIDTMAKLFDDEKRSGGQSVYRSEYREMTALHKIAKEFKIAVVVITHLNKASANNPNGDPMMKVSGSAGVTGAADLVWTFERKSRNAMEARIQSMGKDLPDAIYHLHYDAEHMSWICDDFGCEDNNNVITKQVMVYFEKLGDKEASAPQVADAIGKHRQHVSSAMKRLEVDGFLSRRKVLGGNTVLYKINQELFFDNQGI